MFDLSGGRLLIEKDGKTRLNTDDLLLHGAAAGFSLSGTIVISAISGGNSGGGGPGERNLTTVYDLGAVTPGHTQLIGSVRFALFADTGAGQAFDRWTMVMGGTSIWVMDSEPGFLDAVGDNGTAVNQYVAYSFQIVDGQAQMVRRLYLDDTPAQYTVLEHSIQYKLRSGNWT
jgi:hypothetical protein